MKQFLKDITERDGKSSAKKTFYIVACIVSSIVVLWEAYELPTKDGMDDMAFVWLMLAYLATVGGFEAIIDALRIWKGQSNANTGA